jgi:3-keto-disaccharide hydrolase
MTTRYTSATRLALAATVFCIVGEGRTLLPAAEPDEDGWVTIFDGKSLDGWKINERPETWKFEDGSLIAKGDRSHIFFVGDEKPFVNFELKVDVKAGPHSNGGIYFHTRFQDEDWPKYGHEAQVNNTYEKDPKKTGSLYGIVDVTEQYIPDDTWWTEHVIVRGKHITIKLNDKVVVDHEEPADQPAFSEQFERRLGSGTFALQGHDPESTVYYKNVRVKRLP